MYTTSKPRNEKKLGRKGQQSIRKWGQNKLQHTLILRGGKLFVGPQNTENVHTRQTFKPLGMHTTKNTQQHKKKWNKTTQNRPSKDNSRIMHKQNKTDPICPPQKARTKIKTQGKRVNNRNNFHRINIINIQFHTHKKPSQSTHNRPRANLCTNLFSSTRQKRSTVPNFSTNEKEALFKTKKNSQSNYRD